MLDRKIDCLTANCLQILQFLNSEIFVRSVFLVHLVLLIGSTILHDHCTILANMLVVCEGSW